MRRSPAVAGDVPLPVAAAIEGLSRRFVAIDGAIEGGPERLRARAVQGGLLALTPSASLPDPDTGTLTEVNAAPVVLGTSGASRSRPLNVRSDVEPDLSSEGRLELDRGFAVERFAPTEHGVQQSWLLAQRPQGSGALRIEVAVDGHEYLETTDAGLHFEDPVTGIGIRYGLAYWIDAEGRRTELVPTYVDGVIAIDVPAALVDDSPYPVVLDPEVTPEQEVDDTLSDPSAAQEFETDVAFDGVDTYLAIWKSYRWLEGTRIKADGTLLDSSQIFLTPNLQPNLGSGTTSPLNARVTFAGGRFFIVFQAPDANDRQQIWGLFVELDGSSGTRFQISAASGTLSYTLPDVATSGSELVAAFRRSDNLVMYQPLALDGSLIGGATQFAAVSPSSISIANGGGHYFMAWTAGSPTAQVFARRFSLAVADAQVQLSSGLPAGSQSVLAAWDGGGFSVLWNVFTTVAPSGSGQRIYRNRVTNGTTLLSATGILVTSSGSNPLHDLVAEGGQLRFNWVATSAGFAPTVGAHTATLSVAGVVSNISRLSPPLGPPIPPSTPRLACSAASGCLHLWIDNRASTGDVYFNRTSSAGLPLDGASLEGVRLARSYGEQKDPDVAFDGTNYTVVYYAQLTNSLNILATRLSPSGEVLDAEPIVVQGPYSGGQPLNPHIAFGGGTYLVTWYATTSASTAEMRHRTLSPSGALGPTHALAPPSGYTFNPARLAWSGNDFLMTRFVNRVSPANRYIEAQRYATDGAALGPAFNVTPPGTTLVGSPVVACAGGGQCAVAYIAYDPATFNPLGSFARSVSAANAVGAEQMLDTLGAFTSLAASPSGYLAAWLDGNSAYARRLDGAGLLLGPAFAVSSVLGSTGGTPTLAFDGTDYFVAWTSHDGSKYVIRGAAVTTDGVVVDVPDVVLADTGTDHWAPVLASNGSGAMLLAYYRHDPAPPYGVNRVRARFIDQLVPDTTPPVFEAAPPDVTVEAADASGATVSYALPTADDDVDGPTPVDCFPAPGSVFALGATTVLCTATDNASNSATVSFTVTVQDTTAPAVSCAPIAAECTAPATPVSSTCAATDLVDAAPAVSTDILASYPVGEASYTCTATDAAGNSASVECDVDVADTTAPALVCPPALELECNAVGGVASSDPQVAAWLAQTTASDLCSAATVSHDVPAVLPWGVTSIELTAADAYDNESSCTTGIEVVDTIAPTASCLPATAECTGLATVVATSCAGGDACDGSVALSSTASGAYALGSHSYVCTASDDAGNTGLATCPVNVVDSTAPTASCTGATLECQGPLTAVATTCGGTDVCDGSVSATSDAQPAYAVGTYAFDCSVTDDSGNGDIASCAITVTDAQPPAVSCAGAVQECSGALTPVATACSATDLCDPSIAAVSTAQPSYPLGTHAFSCTASDTSGNAEAATCQVAIVDTTAAAITAISATVGPVAFGTPVTLNATFTAACGPHTASVSWGDGSTGAGAVSEGAGGGSVSASHSYAAAGVYTLTLTVTDASGNVASAQYQYTVAYDPMTGFVTGAGFIQSPAGAYTPDPAATGKAHFGFVAKYQPGASTPSGNTSFRFQAAGLVFESTSYDWLVVAGPHAKYKGVGTLNGAAGYGFMLTATDGEIPGGGGVDRFRMRITAPGGGVVYDNQPGADADANATQAIGAGNIRIQP